MDQAASPSSPSPSWTAPALHAERCPPSSEPSVKTVAPTLSSASSPAKDAVAGACAGAIAKTVVAPIERVKLLMQLQFSIDKPKNKGAATSAAGNKTLLSSRGGNYGAWEVTKQVYREQGILAFWRGEIKRHLVIFPACTGFPLLTSNAILLATGNTPNVIRQGGTSAMNFMLMDWYKRAISPLLVWSLKLPSNRDPEVRQKRRALISSFLSGGLAGGTVTTVLYPVEFVRTRLAMDVGRGTADAPRLYPGGMKDVCLSIWRADGWRGLYQGYGIALAGVVLYRALHLGGYDAVKTEILHRRGHQISLASFNVKEKENQGGSTWQNNVQQNGNTMKEKRADSGLTMGERFLAAQIVSIVAGTACYPIDSIRRRLMMQ